MISSPTYITSIEDPRLIMKKPDNPPTIDDKEAFRLSIASTSTTVSSKRTSTLGGSSGEEDHVTPFNNNNLPPSSRFLLSGYSTAERQRNSILSRFYPSQKEEPPLVDPWHMSVKQAEEECIQSDWMFKYQPPSFTFARTWKRRLFILVDNIVFLFKSSKSTQPAKEHFVLTNDTFVFVTEEFKKGYVIELRKPLMTWYIRCETVNQMRIWLEAMKKIVACIKFGYHGRLNNAILSSLTLTDDYRIVIPSKSSRQSLPPPPAPPKLGINRTYSLQHHSRQSLADIPDWESIIPPQLPPPTCKPPPIPSSNNSSGSLPPVSE